MITIKLDKPTLGGLIALFFWAFMAVFTNFVKSLPIFEILTIVFLVSFLTSLVKIWYCHDWHKLKQPWFLWLIGIAGIYGNDLLYIQAFNYAPPAHADLINYLWPVLVILFSCYLPNEKFSLKYVVGGFVAFAGVVLLIKGDSSTPFKAEYIKGYIYAFFDAVVWATYTLLCRRFNQKAVEAIGFYCGAAALCSFILHYATHEPLVLPSPQQWFVLLLMGLTTQGMAYFLWEKGIKKGQYRFLNVISYATPILSVLLLVFFGQASLSVHLLAAALLVSIGALITTLPSPQATAEAPTKTAAQ